MIEFLTGLLQDLPGLLLKLITLIGGAGAAVTLILTFMSPKKCKAFGCKCGLFVDKFLKTKLGKGPGNRLGDKTFVPLAEGFIECMKRN